MWKLNEINKTDCANPLQLLSGLQNFRTLQLKLRALGQMGKLKTKQKLQKLLVNWKKIVVYLGLIKNNNFCILRFLNN